MAEKYDNPTKDTWRGWAWNQIAERGVRKGSVVVALCGEGGFDLEAGKKKGFIPVGVDTNKICVNGYRKKGGVAICDSLQSQLIALQPKAVIADFLGGATAANLGCLLDAVAICDVVVANLLRGRDKGIKELSGTVPTYRGRHLLMTNIGKHRGKIGLLLLAKLIYEMWWEGSGDHIPQCVFDLLRPSFHSYHSRDSNGLYYDSFAITTSRLNLLDAEPSRLRLAVGLGSRRKAAAAKALVTMQTVDNHNQKA